MYTILEDGWTTFRPETEFNKLVTALSEEWRFSYVNKDYNVSNKYASYFCYHSTFLPKMAWVFFSIFKNFSY